MVLDIHFESDIQYTPKASTKTNSAFKIEIVQIRFNSPFLQLNIYSTLGDLSGQNIVPNEILACSIEKWPIYSLPGPIWTHLTVDIDDFKKSLMIIDK